jgi:hypothetical protein
MSFEWEDDEDTVDVQAGSNAMKELRKAYKEAQRQNKELAEQLGSMQSSIRDRSIKDVIASKGLPEKVSALIPKDATSSEEVEAWLNEYGEIFGVQTGQPSSEGKQSAAPASPELQALARISSTQSTGQPFSNDPDQLGALISSASTPEELNRLLFGNTSGPQAI